MLEKIGMVDADHVVLTQRADRAGASSCSLRGALKGGLSSVASCGVGSPQTARNEHAYTRSLRRKRLCQKSLQILTRKGWGDPTDGPTSAHSHKELTRKRPFEKRLQTRHGFPCSALQTLRMGEGRNSTDCSERGCLHQEFNKKATGSTALTALAAMAPVAALATVSEDPSTSHPEGG